MPSSIDAPIPAIWAVAKPHRDRPKVACPLLPSLPVSPLPLPAYSLPACLFLPSLSVSHFPCQSIPFPTCPPLPRLLATLFRDNLVFSPFPLRYPCARFVVSSPLFFEKERQENEQKDYNAIHNAHRDDDAVQRAPAEWKPYTPHIQGKIGYDEQGEKHDAQHDSLNVCHSSEC